MGLAIIYIYDSTATDFTYNGQPLNKAYEVVVDNMINDSFFVTFHHPLDDKGIYKIIEKDKIVKVHTPDGMQPFRIMDRVKYMDHISIEAWPLFYADMRNKLVKPLAIRGLTGQAAMNMFVNNLLIDTPFTFTSNISDMHDYHTQDTEERENNPNQLYNALDVFKDIVKRWQGELVINGYDVRVVNRLGKNTGALLYEKKNISDFTDEESIQDITTRLYGKAEWTERPEGSDEEVKHKISVKVESPLINAYSGIVFEKQYTNNEIRTEKEMKDWLNLKFTTENIDKPSRNIKVGTNIVDDTVIDLGDSLVLKYVKHDVDMEIRMVGYTYDGYANRYITIQLGDAKQSYVGNVQNTVREIETNVNTAVKQTVNQILNANGERMIYSVTEPVGNFKNGDVWFDQQGGMYFWDEEKGMWIDHPYNRNMNLMASEINTAISTAEDAKALAVSEAEQALADANKYADEKAEAIKQQVDTSVNTAISTAEDAKQTAETSYSNAVAEAERLAEEQTTAFNKKFEENALSMNTLSQATKDADAKAQSALTKAGANANLLTTHQNTLNTINNTTIPSVRTSAETALANAKSAMDEAKLADGKIANYVTTKGLVSGTTVDTKINEATGEISKKITTVEGKIPTEIGGRNLLPNTSSEWKTLVMANGVHFTNFAYDFKPVAGTTYTFSIIVEKVNQNDTVPINLHLGLSTVKGSYTYDLVEWRQNNIPMGKKVSLTYTPSEQEVSTRPWFAFRLRNEQIATTIRYKEVKLEKGNIPTDWTAAEEDNYSKQEFSIFESTYKEDVKGINSTLTELSNKKLDGTTYTTFYNNEYKQTAQGVTDAWTAVNKIVDKNGNTTDTFAKAVYDKNAQRQSAAFQEVTKDLVITATYDAGVKGINQSIDTVRGDLENLKIGGTNLIKQSDTPSKWAFTKYQLQNQVATTTLPNGENGTVMEIGSLEANNGWMRFYYSDMKLDEEYTFSVWIKRANAGTDLGIKINVNSEAYNDGNIRVLAGQGWQRVKVTRKIVRSPGTFNFVELRPESYTWSSSARFYIWHPQLERGNIMSDWSQAPEDLLGKADFTIFKNEYEKNDQTIQNRLTAIDSGKEGSIAYRLNETDSTAKGNTTTISNIKTKPGDQITGYQTIKERSDLYERVIGSSSEANVKNNMARIVMADSVFKTEVIDKTNIDDSNTFSSSTKLRALQNMSTIARDESLAPNGFRATGGSGDPRGSLRIEGVITSNGWWTVSGWFRGSQATDIGFSIDICDSPSSKYFKAGTLNEWQYFEFSHNVTNYSSTYNFVDFMDFWFAYYYFKDIKVEKNHHATAWTPSAIDFATQSHITQLADNINLKVSKADLISEINVSTEGVRIAGKNIQLDGNVYMTSYFQVPNANIKDLAVDKITGTNAQFTTMITKGLTADVITSTMIKADTALFNMLFSTTSATDRLAARDAWIKSANISTLDASKITSGTIAAARLDAGAIVTSGLSANVVKSTHIESSTGLIDKVFANEALIKQLTSKTAFISSIQAININAEKITTGTLDASKVSVVNLDANSITSNEANLIKAGLTSSSGGTLALSGDQLLSTASDGSQVYLQNGLTGTRNPSGATIGQIGYAYESSSPWYSMQISHGSHFQIRMSRGAGELNKQAFYIISGGTESYLNTDNIYLNPSSAGRVRVQGAMTVDKDLRTEGTVLVRSKIEYLNGGFIESKASNSNILFASSNKLIIYTNGSNALEFDANNAVFRRKISENSDIRLKTNIVDMPIDSLEAIRNMEIKKFDYLDGRKNYYGIIAQQAQQYLPELINTDSEGYLMVDKSAMTYVNMHAIQQLDSKVDDEISQLKAQISNLQDELALLKGA